MRGKNRIFVTGTDTGIGKTVFCLILMRYLFQKGFNPFYFKPFQTGCPSPDDPESDANFIYSHIQQLKGKDPSFSVGYCLREPKAPYFAARNEGKEIDIEFVKKILEEREKEYDWIIIEGAGGLYVPVTEDKMIIDVIKLFNADTILVSRASLGTINHTLLSIEALKRKGIRLLGIVFMDKEDTPSDMIEENKKAIEEYSGIPVLEVIGKIHDFSQLPLIDSFLEAIFFSNSNKNKKSNNSCS